MSSVTSKVTFSSNWKRNDLGLLFFGWLLSWLGTLAFYGIGWIGFIFSLPAGTLLYSGTKCLLRAQRHDFALEQFRWLVEHLSARIAAGTTMERAFSEAPCAIKILSGEQSDLFKCLKQIEQHLRANRSLDLMFPELQKVLNCHESAVCLKALTPLRQAGGQISAYIRRQQIMLNEQIALRRDLSADNAQRQTEAMIMMVMPFAMASLLGRTSSLYQLNSAQSTFTAAGLLLAFSLSAIAAHLTLRLSSPQVCLFKERPKTFKDNKVFSNRLIQNTGKFVENIYGHLLPLVYTTKLKRNLLIQARFSTINQKDVISSYHAMKAVYILVAVLPGITITVIDPARFYWMIIFAVACSLFQDQQVMRRSNDIQEDEQLAYPEFLNLVLVLLQSGLSLHKTLEICTKNYQGLGGITLNKLLKELARKMLLGIPAGLALADLSRSCSIPQIQSALLLIERYDRDGGFENLHLLEMQVSVCWSIYRQAAKKQIERRAMLLFVPMSLDLIAILLTAMLPAIQTLQCL